MYLYSIEMVRAVPGHRSTVGLGQKRRWAAVKNGPDGPEGGRKVRGGRYEFGRAAGGVL